MGTFQLFTLSRGLALAGLLIITITSTAATSGSHPPATTAAGNSGGQRQSDHHLPSGSPHVFELNQFNFHASTSDGRLWFVEFYVPWCRSE